MAFYIKSHKTVFIHISKAGGTSIKNWILKNFEGAKVRQKHCTLNHVKKETQIDFDMHFATVRNPYARVHSWYWYHVQGLHTGNTTSHWAEAKEIGFNSWLRRCNKIGDVKNSIWWNQVDFIDVNLPHIVCKIENIGKDFKKIQKHLNCYESLPKSNTSSHNHYREDYEKDTREIIEKHFKNDLDYFNYDF